MQSMLCPLISVILIYRPSARMSLGSTMVTPEEPQTPPVDVAMTLPVATSMLDKGEREKLEKVINGACSVRSEGRSAHLPRFVFCFCVLD